MCFILLKYNIEVKESPHYRGSQRIFPELYLMTIRVFSHYIIWVREFMNPSGNNTNNPRRG
jgi:hypothetical protein